MGIDSPDDAGWLERRAKRGPIVLVEAAVDEDRVFIARQLADPEFADAFAQIFEQRRILDVHGRRSPSRSSAR